MTKQILLQCILNVHDAAKGSKLDDVLFGEIDADLKELFGLFYF